MNADPDQHADAGDDRPQRQHRAPIKTAPKQRAAPAGPFALTFAFGSALAGSFTCTARAGIVIAALAARRRLSRRTLIRGFGRRADAVLRRQLQVKACAARALSSLSPRHESSPASPKYRE